MMKVEILMMTKFRGLSFRIEKLLIGDVTSMIRHSIKHVFIIIFVVSLYISCAKTEKLSFCEGVSPEGNGVKCGSTFTTGDLTAVIAVEDGMTHEKLDVFIYKVLQFNKKERVNDFSVKILSDKKFVTAPLSFYLEGTYSVKIMAGSETIGEKELKIVDTY